MVCSLQDELRLLREQNRALATALQKFHPLPKSEQLALSKKLDSAEGTQEFLSKIQQYIDSPGFLASLDARYCSYVVPSEDHEDQVGVVDLDDIEWWTLVPSEHPECAVEEECLDGGFVWVEESDVVAGIADTITEVVRKIPAAQKLDNTKLQQLLSGTFSELREKSLTGKLWQVCHDRLPLSMYPDCNSFGSLFLFLLIPSQYGTLAMSVCSWGSYGLSLYRDPSTVLWVMRTLYSVLKYACLMVVL